MPAWVSPHPLSFIWRNQMCVIFEAVSWVIHYVWWQMLELIFWIWPRPWSHPADSSTSLWVKHVSNNSKHSEREHTCLNRSIFLFLSFSVFSSSAFRLFLIWLHNRDCGKGKNDLICIIKVWMVLVHRGFQKACFFSFPSSRVSVTAKASCTTSFQVWFLCKSSFTACILSSRTLLLVQSRLREEHALQEVLYKTLLKGAPTALPPRSVTHVHKTAVLEFIRLILQQHMVVSCIC